MHQPTEEYQVRSGLKVYGSLQNRSLVQSRTGQLWALCHVIPDRPQQESPAGPPEDSPDELIALADAILEMAQQSMSAQAKGHPDIQ